LFSGTIDYANSDDPSGLYWRPRSPPDANTILAHITQYTDYLAAQQGHDQNRLNPYRKATSMEQRLNWCAYYHKQEQVFLNHLSDRAAARQVNALQRVVSGPKAPNVSVEKVLRFPEEHFSDLLNKGFVRPHSTSKPDNERLDYKNIAITLLMNRGGLRKSEIFHIYAADIKINRAEGKVQVQVYHPAWGASPDPKYKNRQEFLHAKYALKPRTDYRMSERLYAGWKSPALNSKQYYFEVTFAPDSAAEAFIDAYINYITWQKVQPSSYAHPFAFTNQTGEPETLKNYQRLHKQAVERIGLTCLKDAGTTEHGHRHSYGYRLATLDFKPIEIQKMMHHKNPNSCAVYTQPTDYELSKRLRDSETSQNVPTC
jgi:integrase